MGLQRDSRILEPACGTGNFITRMPHSIGNAGVVGVEIDSITAEIAARLQSENPTVKIMNCPFERSGLQDGSFDLVIGNVPFGEQKIEAQEKTVAQALAESEQAEKDLREAAGLVTAMERITGGTYVQSLVADENDRRNSNIIPNGIRPGGGAIQ